MGNRILKESIFTSNEIDALTWFEDVFFYRLIVSADDYGVYPADPVILAHVLFPKKENITRKMAENALNRLEQLKLITRYRVTGTPAGPVAVIAPDFLRVKTGERLTTFGVAGETLRMALPARVRAGDMLRGPVRNHRTD